MISTSAESYQFYLDEQLRIVDYSPLIIQICQVRQHELLYQPVFHVIQPEIPHIHIQQQLALYQICSFESAYVNIRERFSQKFIATIMRAAEGASHVWVCLLFPSETEEFEEKYYQKKLELQNFIYRISHDLQGPVKTLRGLVNLSRLENDLEGVHKLFDLVDQLAQRLDSLLYGLIEVTEINSGIIGKLTQIDFEQILYSVLNKLHQKYDITSTFFKIENKLNRPYWNYEHLISSMFYHILSNAIEAFQGRQGYQLEVRIQPNHRYGVEITITNDGPDIPEILERKLFFMFTKGAQKEQHFGLGLYVVKNIVEMLKGEVNYRRREEGGAVFSLLLPNLITELQENNQENA
jgi:K+-sensing histidine kinase KdpD